MKTQKLLTIIIALLLVAVNSFAKADDKKDIQKTISFSIDTYIEALKSGYNNNYSAIISDDAKFNLNRNGKVHSHGKSDELKLHSKNNIIAQNCDINYTVITASENYALINVSMKYDFFTRENIVILSMQNDVWKIKEVNSVFK